MSHTEGRAKKLQHFRRYWFNWCNFCSRCYMVRNHSYQTQVSKKKWTFQSIHCYSHIQLLPAEVSMTSFGLGHHYMSQLYQHQFSNIIIIIEEKVILKYSFMKSEVILSYFRHIQKTTLYFQKSFSYTCKFYLLLFFNNRNLKIELHCSYNTISLKKSVSITPLLK